MYICLTNKYITYIDIMEWKDCPRFLADSTTLVVKGFVCQITFPHTNTLLFVPFFYSWISFLKWLLLLIINHLPPANITFTASGQQWHAHFLWQEISSSTLFDVNGGICLILFFYSAHKLHEKEHTYKYAQHQML